MTTFGIPRALSKKQAAPPVSKFAASTIRRRVMQRLQIAQSRRPLRRRSLLISRHSHYSTMGLRWKFRDDPRVHPEETARGPPAGPSPGASQFDVRASSV